jgi:hypothetical protein
MRKERDLRAAIRRDVSPAFAVWVLRRTVWERIRSISERICFRDNVWGLDGSIVVVLGIEGRSLAATM